MKKTILTSLAFITIVMSATAQNWNSKKYRGNGNIVTKERSISDFKKLKVSGSFDVVLTSSSRTNNLSIRTDENLMEHIITEIKEGALIIKKKKYANLKPSNHKNIKIEVSVRPLEYVSLSGSGSIKSDETIKTNSIDTKLAGSGRIELDINSSRSSAKLSGSGHVVLSGSSESIEVDLAGSGSIKARELNTKNSDLSISGSGQIEIQVSKELKARVAGSGSIRYKANSSIKIDSKVSGSGSVRELRN